MKIVIFIKERVKTLIKPISVIIVAGFFISFLYIVLSNRNNESINSDSNLMIKIPEISGNSKYDYSNLESRIGDLEYQIADLESYVDGLESSKISLENRISDLESSNLESRISNFESDISSFRSCLRNYFSGSDYAEENDLYYCAGKLPY